VPPWNSCNGNEKIIPTGKKDAAAEVKTIKKEVTEIGSGIYLGIVALILIVLLLFLLA
jgi:hypothetical protein